MPNYEVMMTVNVPGLGNRAVTQTVAAASLEEAIGLAKPLITITVTQIRLVP